MTTRIFGKSALTLGLALGLIVGSNAEAQETAEYVAPAEDVLAVRQAVLDYINAFYRVAPELIPRSVSLGLAKIGVGSGSDSPDDVTEGRMSFAQLVVSTAEWNADGEVPEDAVKDIVIYEVLDYTASVKLVADWGIDYMHLGKYDGRWLIVNVIYQGHPGERDD